MTNPCVLFVDDEPNVTAALKRAFRNESYEVLSATSAREALAVLENREIDVVVSDEQMPEMPGSELLAQVRSRFPNTIRIMLTGHASLDAAIRAINAGEVYRFFTKPCNEVDLKVSIRQALLQRDLVSHSRRLLDEYRKQSVLLQELERDNPGIARLATDDDGAILVEADDEDPEVLLQRIREQIEKPVGTTRS